MWLGACMTGKGVCMAGEGSAWLGTWLAREGVCGWGGGMHGWKVCMAGACMGGPLAEHPPPRMVGKRAVRILLECCLVFWNVSCSI